MRLALACVLIALLAGCGEQTVTVHAHAPAGGLIPTSSALPSASTASAATATASAAARTFPPKPAIPTTTQPPSTSVASALARPPTHQWPIPYGRERKRQMAAYSLRHYGEDTYVLSEPRVIVEHYTETATAREAYETFAPDVPDSEFHELPNTCAHFLIEPDGRIDQLVPLSLRCRHTTGLNWTAIGIEDVGFSDRAILDNPAQLSASLRLTRWLRCRYSIALENVIGHNESLSSPYHHDRVPAFQHQTHSDWNRTDMHRYRQLLAREPCPALP
jgi:hypothetical protein